MLRFQRKTAIQKSAKAKRAFRSKTRACSSLDVKMVRTNEKAHGRQKVVRRIKQNPIKPDQKSGLCCGCNLLVDQNPV